MSTSANKVYFDIYDKHGSLVKNNISYNLMCKFPQSDFDRFTPREDFTFIEWGYDENEVVWESKPRKLTEMKQLKL